MNQSPHRIFLLLLPCLLAATLARAEMRTWTRASDGNVLTAEFVSATDTQVRLKREDGSQLLVEIASLSRLDQAYISGRTRKSDAPATPMVLPAAVKKVDRMDPLAIETIVANPEITFKVAGFDGGIVELRHGGAEMKVGGFGPQSGFGFGVVRIRLTPVEAPASADVCGFYLESPQGNRYPVHLLVVDAADGKGGRRTLRDIRSMKFDAPTADSAIDCIYVFMIPATADFLKFRLGFATPEAAQ